MINKFFLLISQIDILVNNSGRSQRGLVLDTPGMEVDEAMVNINIFGPISLTKAVLPHMIKQKAGQVVVTSSVAGKVGKLHLKQNMAFLTCK